MVTLLAQTLPTIYSNTHYSTKFHLNHLMLGLCSTACLFCMLHLRSKAVRHRKWMVSSVFYMQCAKPVMEAQGVAWLASQSVFICMAFYYIQDVSSPDAKYTTQTPSVVSNLWQEEENEDRSMQTNLSLKTSSQNIYVCIQSMYSDESGRCFHLIVHWENNLMNLVLFMQCSTNRAL